MKNTHINMDYLIWIGRQGIYVWNKKQGREGSIPFRQDGNSRIPYLPHFSDVWEDSAFYQAELKKLLGRRAMGGYRILAAVPEDLSALEKRAVEEFIYLSVSAKLNRQGIWIFSQSLLVHTPEENFIAVTCSCRCYSVCLVRNGGVEERIFTDINEGEAGLTRRVNELRRRYPEERPEVYYPWTERDFLPEGLGRMVSFEEIAALCRYM